MSYTIEIINDWEKFKADRDLIYFMYYAGNEMQLKYGFDWVNFPMKDYIEKARFALCRRNGKPVGFHLSRLYQSIFDPKIMIAYQDLFFTLPATRAAKLLMDDFIDFGKREANHIITNISEHTNIKSKSLEKLGFSVSEISYQMET